MESNSFNDYNKRFFKVAHCRNHKYIDALKNGIKLKNAQMETYSQNLKEITIAKYKIDLKYTQQTYKNEPKQIMQQKQDWIDVLQLWSLRKHISKSYNQRKMKGQASYIRTSNKLCNQSFRLQQSQRHQRRLTEQTIQHSENIDQDLLQPKHIQLIDPNRNTKISYWNFNQYKYNLPEPNRNKDQYDFCTFRNETQLKRSVCFSSLGSNYRRFRSYKLSQIKKKKMNEDSLTYITAYSRKKYSKAVNSLVLKMRDNINIQRKMRNRTIDIKKHCFL